MGAMKDDVIREIDLEIEYALREAPLAKPPVDLHRRVMFQVNQWNEVSSFHVTWMDLAVSITGSISVSAFLAFFLFMPAPLRAELLWIAEWLEYMGRASLIWIMPCLASAAVLAAGYTMTRSIRASG